jgi:hypothetical protein
MKAKRTLPLMALATAALLALPAAAAERMQAGQWAGTTVTGGKTFNTSNCMAQADVDAINGDAASVLAYLQKSIPAEICKLSDVHVSGDQIVYSSACQAGATTSATTVTTTYHGNSFESVDSKGTKTTAKLVGACK